MSDDTKVRAQVMIDPAILDKVDELAERMKMSRSQFLSVLIEQGIEDSEWIIRVVSSRYMEPVRAALKAWDSAGKKRQAKRRTS